jgi:hypothetical protein
MNQLIIENYNINFYNAVSTSSYTELNTVDKIPSTYKSELTTFLYNWTVDEIDELLLPDIESVLSEEESEIENGSETIQIVIYLDHVTFYPENADSFTIPTLDFKEIVIGWRDFLLEPPLNGSKVDEGSFVV